MVDEKIRNLNDHDLDNQALVRNNELVSDQTQLGKDTSIVFDSVLKSYIAIYLIGVIFSQSQASYV